MTRRPARRRAAIVLCVAAVLTLAACSSSGSGGDNPSAKQSEGVSTFGKAAKTVKAINWGLPTGEPATIDPPNGATFSASLVTMQMCEPLMQMNSDFSMSPLLAELKQPDSLTMVYTLRDDVTFSDGKPMTAEDVVWSLDHNRAPAAVTSFLFANVKSIEATADNEVTIKLTKPDNLLPRELATFAGAIQEKDFSVAAGENLGHAGTGVMCTGPMKFDSWESGRSLTLVRNDRYWNKEKAANADKIVFTFTADSSSVAQALDSGEIDGAYELPPAIIPNLQKSDAGKVVFGSPSTLALGMSVLSDQGALSSPEIRRALSSTIDRNALANAIYHGAAAPGYSLTPRGVWDNGAWSDGAKSVFRGFYDPLKEERKDWGSAEAIAQAKKDAAAAGYNGTPIVIATLAGDATLSQVAQLIQAQAGQAGFKVEIKQLQPIDYANAGYDPAARKGLDLMLGTSFSATPNPLESMQFAVLPGSPYNYTNFEAPEITKLIATAWETEDQTEAAKALVAAEDLYSDEYLNESLVEVNEVLFLNRRLSGAMASFPYLNNPSVARIGTAE